MWEEKKRNGWGELGFEIIKLYVCSTFWRSAIIQKSQKERLKQRAYWDPRGKQALESSKKENEPRLWMQQGGGGSLSTSQKGYEIKCDFWRNYTNQKKLWNFQKSDENMDLCWWLSKSPRWWEDFRHSVKVRNVVTERRCRGMKVPMVAEWTEIWEL